MFQLGRDRSRGSSCRAIMPAIDRKCFAIDRKQTTSHGPGLVLRVHACMEVNETGHAQRLNMSKQRPREVVFSRRS